MENTQDCGERQSDYGGSSEMPACGVSRSSDMENTQDCGERQSDYGGSSEMPACGVSRSSDMENTQDCGERQSDYGGSSEMPACGVSRSSDMENTQDCGERQSDYGGSSEMPACGVSRSSDMENTQDCGESLTDIRAPEEGDRNSSRNPGDSKARDKHGKKKKGKKNKQNKKALLSENSLTNKTSSHEGFSKEEQCVNSVPTCDKSTQTENKPTHTEATQTLPLQCTHTDKPTESKSTNTQRSTLTYKQVYEGQTSSDQSGEHKASSEEQSRDPRLLTVLTWNIDGLDVEDLRQQVPNLLAYLGKHRADVVLLQELIPPYLMILKEIMTDYEFLQGSDSGYFTGILLRKSRVELLQSNIVNYPTTEMGRNLLMATANFSGHQLCLMTSHLESVKTSSQERCNQLRRVWKRMKEAPDGQTVIFGGDTNLRDWEVKKVGGLPDSITDVWEMLGAPEDCMYTWDTVTNNNKDLPFPARLRFDRVYMRTAREGAQLRPDSMTLVGLNKLKCGRFISDHWGILCTFSFLES
ncbi:tyrosyl-DNA phosphodiesterase 2 isoform X2 [Salminus brasiliensis]|uniref:tyrosyl-DNA phosphodiesterase 2 isoform X2 n=1 Tax=Salminus brasiliensis TaxID=930266 RepID=UPI003B833FEB